MAQHNELGEWGEKVAMEYLLADGYIIHRQDKRMKGGEIDIIAFKDREVVFVEVKTRREPVTDPMEVFDGRRRARMCRAADAFIRTMELDLNPRFDIIIVNGTPDEGHRLTHYPDAFLPPMSGMR
ncbi:MAG: YraN family protein [Pseudoflavonifractor sp.]|nr:YraN family protein [Alloprevotella sp.]MCM1117400.1 YraN family protein [Pseudoflavonifractor sp.]